MNNDDMRLLGEMANQVIEKVIEFIDKVCLLEEELKKQETMKETLIDLITLDKKEGEKYE